MQLKSHHDLVYRKFAQVCTELKLLYVGITRPKNFLLIYDDETSVRKPIQEYWRATNVVDVVDKKMAANHDLIPDKVKKALRLTDTPDLVQSESHGKHQSEVIK